MKEATRETHVDAPPSVDWSVLEDVRRRHGSGLPHSPSPAIASVEAARPPSIVAAADILGALGASVSSRA